MAVRVTLKTNIAAGGSGSAFFDDTSFANAAAAISAISNGFIVFPSPVDPGGSVSPDARAYNVASIESIITISGTDPATAVTA
jgi:hypothetical protein